MKRARFSEEQIIGILKAAEVAGNVREVCREHDITEQTFYRWRRKHGGMEVSEAKKLRELERENSELKRVAPGEPADLCLLDRSWAEARRAPSSDNVAATWCRGEIAWKRDGLH